MKKRTGNQASWNRGFEYATSGKTLKRDQPGPKVDPAFLSGFRFGRVAIGA